MPLLLPDVYFGDAEEIAGNGRLLDGSKMIIEACDDYEASDNASLSVPSIYYLLI